MVIRLYLLPFSVLLFVADLSLVLAQTNSTTCYYPDATVSEETFPCNPGYVSTCCPAGTSCVDNQLCLAADGGLLRGSCTDPTWSDPNCLQECFTGPCTFISPGMVLTASTSLIIIHSQRRHHKRTLGRHILLQTASPSLRRWPLLLRRQLLFQFRILLAQWRLRAQTDMDRCRIKLHRLRVPSLDGCIYDEHRQ